MTGFWFLFFGSITERNLFGLDLAVLLELELVSYCFDLNLFLSLTHLEQTLFFYRQRPCLMANSPMADFENHGETSLSLLLPTSCGEAFHTFSHQIVKDVYLASLQDKVLFCFCPANSVPSSHVAWLLTTSHFSY